MFFKWIWNWFDSTNLLLTIITIIILIVFHLVMKDWFYFSKQNVKFVRGWPVLGSFYEFLFGTKSYSEVHLSLYSRFPDEPFIGIYQLTHKLFILRDPDLIKRITTTDFDHFLNHPSNFDLETNSLLARMLIFSCDQQWKEMRTILSPAFTGNKMRLMFSLLHECTKDFMEALKMEEDNDDGGFDMELKDLFSRYATNVIATCAFGLKIDAVTERENDFFLAGKKITNLEGIQAVKLALFETMPRIMKLLRIEFFEKKICDYFRNAINRNVAYREKKNIHRPDMIDLLIQAKKRRLNDNGGNCESAIKNKDWNDDDLVAKCIQFLFAGFETMSTHLCFMGHELAWNSNIQHKLFDEIMKIEEESNGSPLTFETIQNFKYMDMVACETLRLWPPNTIVDRQVTKPYVLKGRDGQEIFLTTEDKIWLPIYGLHLDPKYWPEPNRFDPERFNDENRKNIRAGTYIPFGCGPRKCIADRFSLTVAKIFFYFILSKYEIRKCSKTPKPQVVLKRNTINMDATNGFWVRFQARNRSQ